MNFIEAALKYKQVTLAVLLILFALGAESLLNMPRREDPKITVRTGLVVAQFPGASSVQVEQQLTKKIEEYLFQYEEVDKEKTSSVSSDGLVVVNVELTEAVKKPEVFWNKLRHQLLISKAIELPAGVQGPFVDSDFGDTEAMVIGIESNMADYAQLKTYAKKLEEQIRTIKATSKVKRVGDHQQEIVVAANSGKLAQYELNMGQLIQTLQQQNSIVGSGEIKTFANKTSIYTDGLYRKEDQLANQIVSAPSNGAEVKLKDIATITRGYAEPSSIITVNGNKAVLLTVQMHEGNNIVDFGKEVNQKIQEFKRLTPTTIKTTTLVSQPDLVNHNISHFIKEFFLAIIAVIVVVILLLPLRIASVAAMAIPMTVALTFAILNMIGIELHQVSLAGLILVLGMVVDDAIVIADNYVELLDEGVDRWTASWRSAHDLLIPVLAATITIIASFVPMVLIKGSTGEFIFTLPITVAVALLASYFVALFLTPLLCFTFIKKGLHDHNATNEEHTKKKKSLLTYMQDRYERLLAWSVKNPRSVILTSIIFLLLTGVIFKLFVRELFFPAAERNQFVIELKMPTGTKLEVTSEVIKKAEAMIKDDKRVVSYATFTGTSAPRFYYSFSPEFPRTDYALILVNTTTTETSDELALMLDKKVKEIVSSGHFFVKQMQQGNDLKAPVEVRISGAEIPQLQDIAVKINDILVHSEGSRQVRSDFGEDYFGYGLLPNREAQRLGFTTEYISQAVSRGFKGQSLTSFYEGDEPIDVLFRLQDDVRKNTTDLENLYVPSPLNNAQIPLRQIAEITPQWQTGKIMHRNGVRTLTVQSEISLGSLPAELLEKIKPEIEKLSLPEGYRIYYGGEEAGKTEVESDMYTALSISLALIFLILLFQFKNIKEALIIMATIPLSLFGAILGLAATGNNFSFTAFIGLIALSGIVVRNAIILVDYTNILLKNGMDIKTAAVTAAQRRLRPIFLTAMAAAVGVLPMIISKSPMWAPLASVLAFGVIWSMIMALLTVPVMYIGWINKNDKKEISTTTNKDLQYEV
ncbi:efflux RND transporter permease subunit [Sphingobacterium sp. DR205]|uniref:efflux RND transporter permease subunit n=1 Tax=Sphingobacterium sp. DR205 TaxID=2713573 RepID=UPI0013E4C827|nr:efflux RND transporter permease subunit [Sphingobacterium sp. DR205]QIH35933.1 efflux RND transporter permease subunit [Sphingobacterium sp. DR205]